MKILNQKFYKNIKLLDEIPNNWPNDLLEINVYSTLESYW